MSGLNRRAGIRARPEKKISLAGEFAEAIISRKKLRYPHFRVREWQWLVDLCFRKDTDCRRQSSAYAKKRKRRLKPRTPWLQDKECLTPLPWKGKERHQRIGRAPGYSSNSNCGTGIAPNLGHILFRSWTSLCVPSPQRSPQPQLPQYRPNNCRRSKKPLIAA